MTITATHTIADYEANLITNFLRGVEGTKPLPYYDGIPQGQTTIII
ncbi:MAG: hypothetical protein ABIS30_04185 [Gallionella sp.]|jgi:hypothetical protein